VTTKQKAIIVTGAIAICRKISNSIEWEKESDDVSQRVSGRTNTWPLDQPAFATENTRPRWIERNRLCQASLLIAVCRIARRPGHPQGAGAERAS
jgi:hypothetical protein